MSPFCNKTFCWFVTVGVTSHAPMTEVMNKNLIDLELQSLKIKQYFKNLLLRLNVYVILKRCYYIWG